MVVVVVVVGDWVCGVSSDEGRRERVGVQRNLSLIVDQNKNTRAVLCNTWQ